MHSCPHDAGRQTLPAAPAAKETAQKKSSRFSLSDKSTMAEERERSRSPDPAEAPADGGHAPADDQANGSSEPEGIKLYIGNLDYATDETKLKESFSQFGQLTDVFLPTDRNTGRPRGFGFVTYATRPEAEKAIQQMDQTELDGRTIRVNESRPKGSAPRGPGGAGGFNSAGFSDVKLYVGNLSYDTTEDSLRQLFEQYGTIVDLFMPTDRDSGKPRGFCFVKMPAKDAENACLKLNGYEIDGRALRVNEAQPKGSSGGGRGGGGGGGGGYDDYGGGYGGGYSDYGRGGGRGGGYAPRGGGGGGYDDRYSGGGYSGGGRGGGYDSRYSGGGYQGGGGGGGGYDERYSGGGAGGYSGYGDDRGGYGRY